MKLAEALIERAGLQKQNRAIVRHIEENVRLVEDEELAVSIDNLMRQYEENMDRLSELIKRINKTNSLTEMNGGTITDVIARRDCLNSQISAYGDIYDNAISHDRHHHNNEPRVKYIRHINCKELKDRIDHLSQEFRQLDTALQGKNWTVDLM